MVRIIAAKAAFANGAPSFVSGAPRRLRAALLVVAGALLVAMAAPFGTAGIAPLSRVGFWLSLILLNFALWEAWFAWLGRRGLPWKRVLLLGFPTMLLPLPLEVDLGLRLFAGFEVESHPGVWLRGAAIAGVWALAVLLLPRRLAPEPDARFPDTAIRLDEIAALTSEDHYVRLHLADGSARLIHARFSDAVAAMAGIVGERLGRGAWLADRYRGPAECRNRRWFVRVGKEGRLPVSRSRVGDLRKKGWLAREG